MTDQSISIVDLNKLVDTVLQSAKKADGDASEKTRALDGLKVLSKKTVTTKILAESQAGKRIRALAKGGDADISKLAASLIASWKDVVRQEADANAGSAGLSKSQSTGTAAMTTGTGATAAPAPDKPTTAPASTKTETTMTTQPSGGSLMSVMPPADIPKTGDTIRDKCRDNFGAALQKSVNEGVDGDVVSTAVAVEEALYTSQGGVTQAYKAKFRQLHFNMKDDKNPDLRRKVLTGEITANELMTLPPEELASDEKRDENQKIRDKKLFDSAPSAAKKATTDQFQCGKCKQRQCTYYQMQTRSADEPMTTFVTCLNCNNRWKFC